MSRHRSVRGMTYDEDFDGYDDDLYGHSVEEEYGASPATAEQFMYGGSHRGHQLSSYLENIGEEDDERQAMQEPLADSGTFKKPKLNATDEARLQSCLDEIRSIVGETVPEHFMITKILESDFGFETALDAVLNYQENESHRRAVEKQLPTTVSRNIKGATQMMGHPSDSANRSNLSLNDKYLGHYVQNPSENLHLGGVIDKADGTGVTQPLSGSLYNSYINIAPRAVSNQVTFDGSVPLNDYGAIKEKYAVSEQPLSSLVLSQKKNVDAKTSKVGTSSIFFVKRHDHPESRYGILSQGCSKSKKDNSSSDWSLSHLALGHEGCRVPGSPETGLSLVQLARDDVHQESGSGVPRGGFELGPEDSKPSLSTLAALSEGRAIDSSDGSAKLPALAQGDANQERKHKIYSEVLLEKSAHPLSNQTDMRDRPKFGLGLDSLAGTHIEHSVGTGSHKGSDAISLSALVIDHMAPGLENISVSKVAMDSGVHDSTGVDNSGSSLADLAEKCLENGVTVKCQTSDSGVQSLAEQKSVKQPSNLQPIRADVHHKDVAMAPSGNLLLSELAGLHLSKRNDAPLTSNQPASIETKVDSKKGSHPINREAGLTISKYVRKKKKSDRTGTKDKRLNGSQGAKSFVHSIDVNSDLPADISLPLQSCSRSAFGESFLAEPSEFAKSLCLTYLHSKQKRRGVGLPLGSSKCLKRFRFQRQVSLSKYQDVDYVSNVTPFDFKTPSPDDIVTERQKYAFKSVPLQNK